MRLENACLTEFLFSFDNSQALFFELVSTINVEEEQKSDEKFQKMGFAINKRDALKEVGYKNIQECFNLLNFEENQIETKEDLLRHSNKIAMLSRRGCGNVLFMNSDRIDLIDHKFITPIYTNELECGTGVLMYVGSSYFDRPIFKIRHPNFEGISERYFVNSRFKNMARRFKFKENK